MSLSMYVICFCIGVLGIVFHVILKIKSISDKAKLSHVEFNVKGFFKDDVWGILASFVAIIAELLFIDEVLHWNENIMNYIKFAFFFSGYVGSDILLRVMSFANKRVNAAIDYKTTKYDEANGTLDGPPTPATLPKDTK